MLMRKLCEGLPADPDFFLGMMSGMAVVLLVVSIRFTARGMRRR